MSDGQIRKRPVPLKEEEQRQTLFPKLRSTEPMGEPWRPVMTAEEREAHEKYVADNELPF